MSVRPGKPMPDLLRFLDAEGRKFHEAGWTGPWPPPGRLLVARGRQSGMVSVMERTPDPDLQHDIDRLGSIDLAWFRLRNASSLPDDADFSHVFRGAEYVPE